MYLFCMMTTVYLYGNPACRTIKIKHIQTYAILPKKFCSHLLSTQNTPDPSLGIGWIFP